MIGNQIVSGLTAELLQEIIEDMKESPDDSSPQKTNGVNSFTILKIGGAIAGLIIIVMIIGLVIWTIPI